MKARQTFTLILASFLILFACNDDPKMSPTHANEREHFVGRVTTVKSGNLFRMRGLSRDVKLFGIDLPDDAPRADKARIRLYRLIKGEELSCILMEKTSSNSYVNAVCWVRHVNNVSVLMLKSGHVELNCQEAIIEFGKDICN